MNQALKDLERVVNAFRDKRATSPKSMSRQIFFLATELARRRYVPEPDVCPEDCSKKGIAGCACCWTTWAEMQAIEEAMEDDDD